MKLANLDRSVLATDCAAFARAMFAIFVLVCSTITATAQRTTDRLDRGLVALPGSAGGNFVSWRAFGEEYYDVTYNLYCNGALLAKELKVTNYSHAAGNAASRYQVAAVVRGKEQEKCKETARWNKPYLEIPVQGLKGRDGTDVTQNYSLNDVSMGDLDGDGQVEFVVKRPCSVAADVTQKNCFHVLDCYDMTGKRLWWIDLGPNMLSGADEQWDCVCYDWDGDGKAEVLLRGADNMYIHHADGSTTKIGNDADTRWNGMEYTSSGNEYLLYLEGLTGKPYQIGPASHPDYLDYPNPRGDDNDWNPGGKGIVGHRSTKHYFAAPFFDGRKASIFLGRGCYTKHLMKAFDVDPATHKLTQRWVWECKAEGPWFGQGYHNFQVADVDWDGRDEIVFGSMIIDDNGKGLSTTGLGHGDAQHCSDLDPYRKYQEQFACNESSPAMNYRNALTSQFYYRAVATGDDGRALCANFTDDYPGSQGRSVSTTWISTSADKELTVLGGDAFISWGDLNQRIYWDGDLCDEYFDSPGTEGYGVVYKPASKSASGGRWNFSESKCVNWSKNNPCALGDILGDWREEVVMRKPDNTALLIYSTNIPTTYRITTLWHDHQYRNAMVWQSMGYNQPPHKSYFLGKKEEITRDPAPLTMSGRKEVADGGTIVSTDEHLIVCETKDSRIKMADNASPYIVTFNVPSWVKGTAGNDCTSKNTPIEYEYYTCTVTGGSLSGATRLVKQGDGILVLPKADMTHTGATDVWAGTLQFDGTMRQSPLWLNRFAELHSDGGVFKSVKADYASVLCPGGKEKVGTLTVEDTYSMGFGSRLVLDVSSDGFEADKVDIGTLEIETKTTDEWVNYGPRYLQPVIEIAEHRAEGQATLAPGSYVIGKVKTLKGSLADIKIEGVTDLKAALRRAEDGTLTLELSAVRGATDIQWTGAQSAVWDFAKTENFSLDGSAQKADVFVKGDIVNFGDDAGNTSVTLVGTLEPDSVKVNVSKNYSFGGNGSIASGALVKEGKGVLAISTENAYVGGNYLNGGVVSVSVLSNENKSTGNLGGVTTNANKFVISRGATLRSTAPVTNGSPIRFNGEEGGCIENTADFNQNKAFSGTVLTKRGAGWLKTYASGASLERLVIESGTVMNNNGVAAKTVEFCGGALNDVVGTNNTLHVPSKKKGAWTTANRQNYDNKLTGEGELTVFCALEKGNNYYATRTPLNLNLKEFSGILIAQSTYAADGRFTFDTNAGSADFTLQIPEGVHVQNSGKTLRIGKLAGSGFLGGFCAFRNGVAAQSNTWQVGNDDNFKFAGCVEGNDHFTKMGVGRMTATKAWTTTGNIRVNAGELCVEPGATLGTGTLFVAEGATFCGTTKANVPLAHGSVTVNGTLQAGELPTSTSGYLDFGGKNVTIGAKAQIVIGLRRGTDRVINNTYLKNIGTLRLAANATIAPTMTKRNMEQLTTDETVADSFYVWTDVKNVSVDGEINLVLPELLPYNYWDTSRVKEGILYVRCDARKYQEYLTGITPFRADEIVTAKVVNTRGICVDTMVCSMQKLSATFSEKSFPKGVYLLHVTGATGKTSTLKMMK